LDAIVQEVEWENEFSPLVESSVLEAELSLDAVFGQYAG
jgi:hypothetical protein